MKNIAIKKRLYIQITTKGEKTMKKTICLAFVIVMLLSFPVKIFATSDSDNQPLRNNNTILTDTTFSITSDGVANVSVCYVGYPNVTTGATIEIVIKKNTFLFFWSKVVEDTIIVATEDYSRDLQYDISSNGHGTYKCFVTYTISGTGGPDDVIPFESSDTY